MTIDFIKAIFSLLRINLVIQLNKIFYPEIKIIFFYWPRKNKIRNEKYIEDLLDNFGKDFLVIFGFNSPKVLKNKRNFYIKYGFLKWIYKIDLFFDNTCVDVFTNKSIKIFLHHDIYDTPLVDIKKEKELFERINKYDFIFLSNNKNITMFKNFFDKHNLGLNSKMPSLMEVGYVKLDYLKKKVEQGKSVNNNIIIAPTLYNHVEKLSMYDDLKEIIKILLTNTTSKIIFRPHPDNRKTTIVLEIEKNFKDEQNFEMDKSNDYFDTYTNSICMISDLSGTAYTYAFLTKKPVIFFSKNEKLINSSEFGNICYFKDREKIGVVVRDMNEVKNAITNIKYIKEKIKTSNDLLEKEISYLGNSKNRIRELITEILIEKKKLRENHKKKEKIIKRK